ncbi:MAG TPA: hypothetical protein VGI45_18655 [Terracidiphilus sp.]|jgi:hypothetical protein
MPRKIPFVFALICVSCLSLDAQDKDARDRLAAAHSQYYTPTTSGLKSFHCDASIDWKAMLSRFSGTDVPDDNPALKFLQSVHLAVNDDLKGQGALEWTNAGQPPDDKKAGIQQIQEGLQTSVAGFFQTWNAYMNGSMVPVPDNNTTVTKSGDGVHLSGTSKDMTFDEDFDKNMLLIQALVVGPNLKVLAIPTFALTPDGLVISSVASQVHQPPTAPETDATFRIDYARVESYQLPSQIAFDIKNTGVIEIGFSACKVTLFDWAKKQ